MANSLSSNIRFMIITRIFPRSYQTSCKYIRHLLDGAGRGELGVLRHAVCLFTENSTVTILCQNAQNTLSGMKM